MCSVAPLAFSYYNILKRRFCLKTYDLKVEKNPIKLYVNVYTLLELNNVDTRVVMDGQTDRQTDIHTTHTRRVLQPSCACAPRVKDNT